MINGGRHLSVLLRGSEGSIAGTVVCAAAIAAGAGHWESAWRLSIAIVATVLIYWIAHLHAVTLGSSLAKGHHPLLALRHSAAETAPIAASWVLPVAVLLAATLLGADLQAASWAAGIATIALLAVYSYLAGARSGLGLSGRLASAVAGASIGVMIELLKALQK